VTDTGTRPKASEGVEFFATIPVIRMFDVGKAKEFYVDFLGFTIDLEGHFREGAPLYMQLSRDGLTLRASNLRRATRPRRNPKAEAMQLDDRGDHTQAQAQAFDVSTFV
jgi:Glyoxalase superfamily protein